MTKIKISLEDPEIRAVWNAALRARDEVASWPAWKRGEDDSKDNSTVSSIDRATGSYRVVLDHLPYRITGAGGATCAPERDQ